MEATGAEYFGIHVFAGRRGAAGIPEHLCFAMRRSQKFILPVYQRCGLFEPTFEGGRHILEQSNCSRVRGSYIWNIQLHD